MPAKIFSRGKEKVYKKSRNMSKKLLKYKDIITKSFTRFEKKEDRQ